MSAAATSLKTLADQQTASVSQLQQMNNSLQDSSTRTRVMATASQKQLEILQDEQASRLAQLSKKPRLALYVESTPADTFFKVNFKPREETDTSTTINLVLVNEGESIATRPLLRMIVEGREVSAASTATQFQKLIEAPDSAAHVYIVPIDNVRPKVRIPMNVTFTYPKGQAPFGVMFNCDADEIATATPLGSIKLAPRKPQAESNK